MIHIANYKCTFNAMAIEKKAIELSKLKAYLNPEQM